MKSESNFKNSPFYVEYTGTTNYKKNTIAFHPKQDFNKDLREFFKSRFGADTKDGEILEQIVSDYYFKYAHSTKSYGRTIIALIPKEHMASDKPMIVPFDIVDRFPKDRYDTIIDEEIIANFGVMEYVAYIRQFKDADAFIQKMITKTIVSDGFEIEKYGVFDSLKNFNEDSLKDFFVLEIPLNNYLDSKKNGVYCYLDENTGDGIESLHVGLAMTNSNAGDMNAIPIPIVYAWSIDEDFDIVIHEISKVNLRELERLCQRYNINMFMHLKLFEISNIDDDFKLDEIRHEKRKLQEQMDRLDEQEQSILESRKNKKTDN